MLPKEKIKEEEISRRIVKNYFVKRGFKNLEPISIDSMIGSLACELKMSKQELKEYFREMSEEIVHEAFK